jgi:putative NADH-flavin reductase
MAAIKNVAIVGVSRYSLFEFSVEDIANLGHQQGAGSLGVLVVDALVRSGKFIVTVVKRPSSTATFPVSVKVVTADLLSVDSVRGAFKGQDVVVSCVGTAGLPDRAVLIDACCCRCEAVPSP